MKRTTAGLSVIAGAALFDAVLIPGVLIGAAAMLAPKILGLANRRRQAARTTRFRPVEPAGTQTGSPGIEKRSASLAEGSVKKAILKTLTFRLIATSLDFTSNILVIGDLGSAAVLSAYGLIAGPLFYFAHEMFWQRHGHSTTAVDLRTLPRQPPSENPALASGRRFTINRAMKKTITYRAIVTTTDFTANFVVAGDLAKAVGLTAFGFVVGPFVYYGHEKAWDYFSARREADSRRSALSRA